jgi:hypothetical protein
MTRTAADRASELLATFARRSAARMQSEFTERVVELHDVDPLWVMDDGANRVLRILRSQPISGKHLIYCMGPDGPWSLARVTHGAPGNLVILPETFDNYEDAMRAVFHARRASFLESLPPISTEANSSYRSEGS